MLKLIKIEFSRAFKNKYLLLSIFIGCLIAITHVIQNVIPCVKALDLDWSKGFYPHSVFNKWMGGEIYSIQPYLYFLIAPILAAIPFADSFYLDKKSGFLKNIFIRTKKRNYYISKYLSTFITGGAAVVIPLALNFILTSMFLPALTPESCAGTFMIMDMSMWADLFYSNPYIYVLMYLILDFVFFGLVATIALAISHSLNNRFAVLLAPFLYYVIFMFTLNLTGNSLFDPSIILKPSQPYTGIDINIIIIEIAILLAITSGIFIYKGVRDDTY